MPAEYDVFLSHNSRDKPIVETIAAHLKAEGIIAWLDKDELRPGFSFHQGLVAGMEASRSVAVFFGQNGMGRWQEPEIWDFVDRSRSEKIPVIPVLLPDCPESPQLDHFLRAFTWVDLRQGVTEEGLGRLVWGITGVRPGPISLHTPVSTLYQQRQEPIRGFQRRLLAARSLDDLRRIKVELEAHLEENPQDVDARLLVDKARAAFRAELPRPRAGSDRAGSGCLVGALSLFAVLIALLTTANILGAFPK